MKRKIIGLGVVVLAIAFSAFTNHAESVKSKKMGNYYWFSLDPVSGYPQTSSQLIYGADPSNCIFIGLGNYCSAGYSGYTHDIYGYHAAGYQITIHYYPN